MDSATSDVTASSDGGQLPATPPKPFLIMGVMLIMGLLHLPMLLLMLDNYQLPHPKPLLIMGVMLIMGLRLMVSRGSVSMIQLGVMLRMGLRLMVSRGFVSMIQMSLPRILISHLGVHHGHQLHWTRVWRSWEGRFAHFKMTFASGKVSGAINCDSWTPRAGRMLQTSSS